MAASKPQNRSQLAFVGLLAFELPHDLLFCCLSLKPAWSVQGGARVLRCLQDFREELGYECRATLFDQEVRMAEDIDFKYAMKRACAPEIGRFCSSVPHGRADIIRCLQVAPR